VQARGLVTALAIRLVQDFRLGAAEVQHRDLGDARVITHESILRGDAHAGH
jgi:hypothetical protein